MYTQLLICSVIKQMMSMVEDFRTMCDYCWMSSVILGQIPKFDKLIATIRSREISASIILQSQSQLKPFIRMRLKPSQGIAIPYYFLEERKAPR